MPSSNPTSQTIKPADLEIKDAQVIFKTVWESLEESLGEDNLWFPKELILLGGAPGAGKGTQTRFIMKTRGLTCRPIVVSELLTSPEAKKLIDQGQLVGDTDVIKLIFNELLKPEYRDGALLDGYPRTRVQVESLKMLIDRLHQLNNKYAGTSLAVRFRNPVVHAVVLFASKRTSVERQLFRGKQIEEQNRKVEETGVGTKTEIRATDVSSDYAEERYRIFKEQTWDALQSLKEIYHYHFINAEGPIKEVQENIFRELAYQSSLELEEQTFNTVNSLPIANDITVHARQELVKRLDGYAIARPELFGKIVDLIRSDIMPVITRHALSGRASVRIQNDIFCDAEAEAMLIDIFSERGYHVVMDQIVQQIPDYVDLATGKITCRQLIAYKVQIFFEGSSIRRR